MARILSVDVQQIQSEIHSSEKYFENNDPNSCIQAIDKTKELIAKYGNTIKAISSTSKTCDEFGSVCQILDFNQIIAKIQLTCSRNCMEQHMENHQSDLLKICKKLVVLGQDGLNLRIMCLYSCLWLQFSFSNHNPFVPVDVIECMHLCLQDVLRFYKCGTSLQNAYPDELEILNVWEVVMHNIHDFEGNHNVFLLYLMCVSVLLQVNQLQTVILKGYCLLLRDIIIKWDSISQNQCVLDVELKVNPKFFCLGFRQMFLVFNKEFCCFIHELLVVTHAVCCINLQWFQDAVMPMNLRNLPENLEYPQLWTYLKSLLHYHLNEYDIALLELTKVNSSALNELTAGRFNLLKGKILEKRGQIIDAQIQYLSSLHIVELRGEALQLLTESHTALLKEFEKSSLTNSSIVDYDVNADKILMTKFRHTHMLLLNLLLKTYSSESKSCNVFEYNIFKKVDNNKSMQIENVMYLIAREFFNRQDFDTACKKYMQLLSNILSKPRALNITFSDSVIMANIYTVYHETITALIKGSYFLEAEILCKASNLHYKSSQTELPFYLNEDIIALMLLADIYRLKNNEQEIEELRKCQQVCMKYVMCSSKLTSIPRNLMTIPYSKMLIYALISQIYLQKALIFVKKNFKNDAFENFKRSLTYNPGNKDALHCFESFNVDKKYSLDVKENQFSMPSSLCKERNLALDYLLEGRRLQIQGTYNNEDSSLENIFS